MELHWMSAVEMAEKIRTGQLDEVEVAEHFIKRVEQINPKINAIVQFNPDEVRQDAIALRNQRLRSGVLGSLHGVPYTIKDMTNVKGKPTTFGMLPFKDNIASDDAELVKRLRQAGGLYLGKTNTPESGYYGGTDNHLYGATHNPWKHGHTAGGSSGGAAACVAAGLSPLAEGSDGAGSVRIPASLCGVVGLKPTTGIIPQTVLPGRYYNWAYHGPLTRTASDNALMLDILAGPSIADPMTIERVEQSYLHAIFGSIQGLKAAWSPNLGLGHVDPEVESICLKAVKALETAGVHVNDAKPNWPETEQIIKAEWQGLWVPGLGSEHDMLDWDSLTGQVDDHLITLMKEAKRTTAVDIGNAEIIRGGMWDEWTRFMQDYDLMISPTVASASFPLEQFTPSWLKDKSLAEQLLGWLFTYPFNMLNNPAISIPVGFTADGRPVGLQIAARHRQDALLLRVARVMEEVQGIMHQHPNLDE